MNLRSKIFDVSDHFDYKLVIHQIIHVIKLEVHMINTIVPIILGAGKGGRFGEGVLHHGELIVIHHHCSQSGLFVNCRR